MANTAKKTIFSGVQPSGNLHIGNYIGALSKWVEMQNEYNCIFCVVDLHAITVRQDPKALNRRILDIVKHYLASGINPEKSIIFQQSDVSAHAELAWILNCVARISDLNKMTQFKDKAGKNQENVSVGLFDYPTLMAADILLYDTDAVPVGDDQVQHVELTRTLGRRFNSQFGEIFKIPEVVIRKEGARIMSLLDPAKKMSKSDNTTGNFLALSDTPDEAEKKIMRAVTDSGSEIIYDRGQKPALANLLTIYSLLDHTPIKDLEKSYQGKGYADFKRDLVCVVKKFLAEYHLKFNSFSDDSVREILKQGAVKARPLAEETLRKAKRAIGINVIV